MTTNRQHLEISDLQQIHKKISLEPTVGEIHDLVAKTSIRPKALMTTLFSRLIASDMFIHGIGGSKYDQITDEIASRFFEVRLPEYLTATSTFLLRPDYPVFDTQRISKLRQTVRQLRFHPESFIENPNEEANRWIQEKQHWINNALPPGSRLPRHQAIEAANHSLQPFVENQKQTLDQEIAELLSRRANETVLSSREYSFCLHPESIVEELLDLAKTPVHKMNE